MPAKPFSLTVKAVAFDSQNRCLLLRRSAANKNFAGCWEWPGGKVDAGEDFATAVLRETREETSLAVEITGLAGTTQFEMPKTYVVLLCMEVRILGGEVKLSDEHDAFEWVPLAEWNRYKFTPGVGDFMLEYAQRKGAIL
jgi:8-oxo-dGTP diphosphatase